jgi:hypothetical protein
LAGLPHRPRAARAALAGALLVIPAVAASCGGGHAPSADAPRTPAPRGTVSASGSGVQVLFARAVTVAARSSTDVPVAFQGERNASLLVLGPRAAELDGRLGATRLARARLFGSPTLVGSFRRPHDGTLRLRNPTGAGISVRVIATAESRRRLVVSTPAEPTAPGTPVHIVVRLTEASAHDRPLVSVRDDTSGKTLLTTNPQKVGKGRWLLTFTPGRAGDYTASAWVGGSRSRAAHDSFFVIGPAGSDDGSS